MFTSTSYSTTETHRPAVETVLTLIATGHETIPATQPSTSWSEAVMECMVRMMEEAEVDSKFPAPPSSVAASAQFFRKLSPYLGPQVRDIHGRPVQVYPSFMCDDGTPVEFGMGVKDDRFHFRLSIEAIDSAASRSRANIHSGLVLVDRLAKQGHADLTLFRRFAKHFLCTRVSTEDLKRCQSSQLFFGFDSSPSTGELSVKSYFIPDLHCSLNGVDAMTSLDNLLRTLGGPWSSSSSWRRLLSHYRASQCSSSTTPSRAQVAPLKPVIISVDCKDAAEARIKIYFRFNTFDIEQAAWHLACGDESQLATYRDHLEHIWRTLLGIQETEDVQEGIMARYAPSEIKSKCAATQGLLIYHEFSAAASRSTSKVYIPIRHFKRTDRDIMRSVVTLDREQAYAASASKSSQRPLSEEALLEKMQRVLDVGLPHLDHYNASCHNYVTAAFKSNNRVEYSSYINPRVFSSIDAYI